MRSLAAAVAALFEPTSDRRLVGVELELLVYHQDRRLAVSIPESAAALAGDPELVADANISFEPGGQIELSPAPDSDPERMIRRLEALVDRTQQALAASGLTAVLQGTDAWRRNETVGLQKRSERYLHMQQHFDRIGPWGRRMMRQTAGLQVCISLEQGEAGRQQWLLANLMAPVLQAMFANSPVLERRATGMASTRSALWQQLDPSRTGFRDYSFEGDPVEGYLRFAAGAAWIPIASSTPIDTHLSTLFPPVRPRGDYLELRCLDAVPMSQVAIGVRLVSKLLQDPDNRTAALAYLKARQLDRLQTWRRAARCGLADPDLAKVATRLLEIAELDCPLGLVA